MLLLDDKMDRGMIGTDPHVLSLSHGVIEMEQLSPDYGKSRRRLRVLKLRGVKFREGYHDYIIETGGLRVFPRLVAAEHYAKSRTRTRFQRYQGAGRFIWWRFGSRHHDTNSRRRRHRQIHARFAVCQTNGVKWRAGRDLFAFDESRAILLARAKALGLDLEEHVESGVSLCSK